MTRQTRSVQPPWSAGLPVIPLRPKNKMPDITNWSLYGRQMPTETEQMGWLTADAFAAQIDALVAENGGVPPAEEEGQFSLPGAQAKVALRWIME